MGGAMAWVDRVEGIRQSRWARWGFYGMLGLMVVLDVVVSREHVLFGWERLPGFSAVYGFVSCALIIVVSKVVGHAWLMKREDYYD